MICLPFALFLMSESLCLARVLITWLYSTPCHPPPPSTCENCLFHPFLSRIPVCVLVLSLSLSPSLWELTAFGGRYRWPHQRASITSCLATRLRALEWLHYYIHTTISPCLSFSLIFTPFLSIFFFFFFLQFEHPSPAACYLSLFAVHFSRPHRRFTVRRIPAATGTITSKIKLYLPL